MFVPSSHAVTKQIIGTASTPTLNPTTSRTGWDQSSSSCSASNQPGRAKHQATARSWSTGTRTLTCPLSHATGRAATRATDYNPAVVDIALVNLPFQGRIASVAQTSVGPPMGLAYLGAVLRDAGHQVDLVDANATPTPLEQLADRIADLSPAVVGLTAATPSIDLAGEFARLLKARCGARVAVGGPHPTALPLRTLREYPELDVTVTGEGEPIVDTLVRALAGDGDLRGVPSIAWRSPAGPVLNAPAAAPAHLDDIPFPLRDPLPNRSYRTIDARPMTCMIAMRGCPAGCVYCNVPGLAGKGMRRRSAANIVAEIERVYRRWGVGFVSFLDDTFSTSRPWVQELCDALVAARLPGRVAWSCLTRPDMVDEDLLRTMRRAGMVRVEFGIESGSPRILELLGKGVKMPRIREAFAAARRQGLVTLGFAMVNAPSERPEEMEQTAQEVLRIDPDFLQLSFCTPYPGTWLWDHCREQDLITSERWSDFRFLRTPLIRNERLSPEQVVAAHRSILRRFYGRPRKALALARYGLTSPRVARSLGRTAVEALVYLARR